MDDATEQMEYKTIQVSGTTSVKKVDQEPTGISTTILLMGPTGAGKSTLIEAVAGTFSLRISSNQLEGFTESISTYRVDGVTDAQDRPIYLVDSPGFADTKVSEISIVVGLQEWARRNQEAHFDHVLYLSPINSMRLPGSQRQTLRLVKTLIGSERANTVALVTTMWDTIAGERAQKRAEMNFEQRRDDVWKDFIQEGAQIVKFLNTRDSALSILDQALSGMRNNYFSVPQDIRQAPVALNLYHELQARIQNLHFRRAEMQLDLSRAILFGDHPLKAILRPRLLEDEELLAKFRQERQDFGPPPTFEADHDDTNSSTSGSGEYVVDISRLVAPTAAPRLGQPSWTNELTLSNRADSQQAAHASDVPARAVQPQSRKTLESFIAFIKCWGKSVGERHEN